jgi:hypothetical protein
MGFGSSPLANSAIGTVAVVLELFVDLVEELSRRIVSIARLYIAASHTSMEE